MENHFDAAVEETLQKEGGYSNDPDDPGGETIWGITKRTATRFGYDGEMRDMTRDQAIGIYRQRYWQPLGLDSIEHKELCLRLFDQGVNLGLHYPALWLQENLNVLNNRGKRWRDIFEDGEIGSQSITTANIAMRDPDIAACMLMLAKAEQAVRYKKISRHKELLEKYVKGWLLKRVIE